MANTILYDGDSERLDSEAEISRITRSGGGILIHPPLDLNTLITITHLFQEKECAAHLSGSSK